MTSYMTSSKMQFTNKDGLQQKLFKRKKHDTANQLLKE